MKDRIHILSALAKAFDGLDETLVILRSSRSRGEASERLSNALDLDEVQVKSILEIPLFRLVQLEVDSLREQLAEKEEQAQRIMTLLSSDKKRWSLVRAELRKLRKQYGDKRRTVLGGPAQTLSYSEESYILDEDVFVVVTRTGWIKRQRSYSDLSTIRVREDDAIGWVLRGSTRRTVILFTDRARAFTVRIDDVVSTTGYGEPIQARFDFEDGEHIVGVVLTDPRLVPADLEQIQGLAVSKGGYAVRFTLSAYESPSTVNGRRFMRLKKDSDDAVIGVEFCGHRDVPEIISLVTARSRAVTLQAEDVSVLKGIGKGIKLVSMQRGDTVLGFKIVTRNHDGLEVETQRGRKLKVTPAKYPPVRKGALGRLILRRETLAGVVLQPTEWHGEDGPVEDVAEASPEEAEPEAQDAASEPAAGAPIEAAPKKKKKSAAKPKPTPPKKKSKAKVEDSVETQLFPWARAATEE